MSTRIGSAAIAVSCLLLMGSSGPVQAQIQVPLIPPEALDRTLHLGNDELRICLNMTSILVEFDRAVATAIADALLLRPVFYEIEYPRPQVVDYRIPLNETQLYVQMNNNCDALAGYRAVAGNVPEWMTVSRPYFESNTVFASSNETYRSFTDIPAGDRIGIRLGSTGHRELITYLDTLPGGQRPRQVPYPNNEFLIERLRDGSVDTIYVWELAPAFVTNGDVAALGIKSTFGTPFAVDTIKFSFALMREDTFLRGLIDEAIEALAADGTIEQLVRDVLPPPISAN